MNNDIDIVLTWVNNSDPQWLKDYYSFKKKDNSKTSGQQRFEDLDLLQFIFRGIEKFMPWIRKIHLVTADQVPPWLNLDHPKLNLVSHKQIFPDNSYLPTFNSNAIEMCFCNISDLSEKFIYFNDDMFVINPLNKKRFFDKNLPKDFLALKLLHHDGVFTHILHSTMEVINEELEGKVNFILKNCFKMFNSKYGFLINARNFILLHFTPFSLFQIYHHPQPLLKSKVIEITKRHPIPIEITRRNRFRSPTDITQYIFRYINLIQGNFIPYYPHDAIYIPITKKINLEKELKSLNNKTKYNLVCFNEHDYFDTKQYKAIKTLINEYLKSILPTKSSYEY